MRSEQPSNRGQGWCEPKALIHTARDRVLIRLSRTHVARYLLLTLVIRSITAACAGTTVA